jgi:hypothetical protein
MSDDEDMTTVNDSPPVKETARERRERERTEAREARRLRAQQYDEATTNAAIDSGLEVDGYEEDDEYERERVMRANARRRRYEPVFLADLPARNEISQAERLEFLRNVGETFNWNQSAYMVGRTGAAFRNLAKEDPFFSAMVAEAVQDFKESVFAETAHRALKGVAKPVFSSQMGCKIGTIIEKSDRLLEFLLKGLDRRFKENNGGVSVNVGNTGGGVVVVPGVAKSDEEFANSVALVEEQRGKEALPPRQLKRRITPP